MSNAELFKTRSTKPGRNGNSATKVVTSYYSTPDWTPASLSSDLERFQAFTVTEVRWHQKGVSLRRRIRLQKLSKTTSSCTKVKVVPRPLLSSGKQEVSWHLRWAARQNPLSIFATLICRFWGCRCGFFFSSQTLRGCRWEGWIVTFQVWSSQRWWHSLWQLFCYMTGSCYA